MQCLLAQAPRDLTAILSDIRGTRSLGLDIGRQSGPLPESPAVHENLGSPLRFSGDARQQAELTAAYQRRRSASSAARASYRPRRMPLRLARIRWMWAILHPAPVGSVLPVTIPQVLARIRSRRRVRRLALAATHVASDRIRIVPTHCGAI